MMHGARWNIDSPISGQWMIHQARCTVDDCKGFSAPFWAAFHGELRLFSVYLSAHRGFGPGRYVRWGYFFYYDKDRVQHRTECHYQGRQTYYCFIHSFTVLDGMYNICYTCPRT